MLQAFLNAAKLEKAIGKKLTGLGFAYGGLAVIADEFHYHVDLPDDEIPAAIEQMIDFFCLEEAIAGPGKQWRHGFYKHRETGDATAYFDGTGNRTLKMRATTKRDLLALRRIVLRIAPGNRERIDGLTEPPVDDWNAGFTAGQLASETAIKPTNPNLHGVCMLMQIEGGEEIWQAFLAWQDTQPDKGGNAPLMRWLSTVIAANKTATT